MTPSTMSSLSSLIFNSSHLSPHTKGRNDCGSVLVVLLNIHKFYHETPRRQSKQTSGKKKTGRLRVARLLCVAKNLLVDSLQPHRNLAWIVVRLPPTRKEIRINLFKEPNPFQGWIFLRPITTIRTDCLVPVHYECLSHSVIIVMTNNLELKHVVANYSHRETPISHIWRQPFDYRRLGPAEPPLFFQY